ncbi:MAG: CBS domain-containing protein [Magnetococcales bacterium]|nr:CBS domain-containing protein [Magnetococcales bacterium]
MKNSIDSIIISNVPMIQEDRSVFEAANEMLRHHHGHVVVVKGDPGAVQVTGFFTERDLMSRVVGQNRLPDETPVREVMTNNLIKVQRDAGCKECISTMHANRCRHLLVFDRETYMGVISIRDVAGQLHRQNTMSELLQKVMTGVFVISVAGVILLLLSFIPELIDFTSRE